MLQETFDNANLLLRIPNAKNDSCCHRRLLVCERSCLLAAIKTREPLGVEREGAFVEEQGVWKSARGDNE